MPSRRAIVHIGIHRTGASHLQEQFRNCDVPLRARGIRRPLPGQSNQGVPLYTLLASNADEYNRSKNNGRELPDIVALRDRIVRRFHETLEGEWSTMLISGEDLSNLPREDIPSLRELLERHVDTVRIIAYTRDPISFADSLAGTRLRQGQRLPMARPESPRLRERLEKFVEEFGQDAVIVRDYATACAGPGLVRDFESAAELPEGILGEAAARTDRALSVLGACILSGYNERVACTIPDQAPGCLRTNPARQTDDETILALAESREGPAFRFTSKMYADFIEKERADVLWLRDRFGIDYTSRMIAPDGDAEGVPTPRQIEQGRRIAARSLGVEEHSRSAPPPNGLAPSRIQSPPAGTIPAPAGAGAIAELAIANPIFVLGAWRSGTSAMRQLFWREYGIPSYLEGYVWHTVLAMQEGVESTIASLGGAQQPGIAGFAIMQLSRNQIVARYAATLLDAHRDQFGTLRFLDKTPGPETIRSAPLLAELMPNAQFICMQRNGLENVQSQLRRFGRRSLQGACESWNECMHAWEQARSALGERAITIDQGDFRGKTEAVARRIVDFIEPDVDRAYARTVEFFRNNAPEQTKEPSQAPPRLRDTGWQEHQQELFVELCGETMRRAGYHFE